VFTLLDASAVIQVSGSALQIVATGMVLNVVGPGELLHADIEAVPRAHDPRVGAHGAVQAAA
jgi:hypothetical protein